MDWQNWLAEHWFDLVQTIGIVASLAFAGIALNADAKAKRIGNLLTITQQNRELWSQIFTQPELTRILKADAKLTQEPLTEKEDRFVRFLILHLNSAYQAIKADVYDKPAGLEADMKEFFTLPIPHAVWEKMKEYCDPDFVKFVEADEWGK